MGKSQMLRQNTFCFCLRLFGPIFVASWSAASPYVTYQVMLRWLDTVLLKIDSFTKPQNWASTNFYSIVLCWMWKVFSLHKLLYEVQNFFKIRFVTAVAMATMTFHYGGYFAFKLILLEKNVGDPHFYCIKHCSMLFRSILASLKKFCHGKN